MNATLKCDPRSLPAPPVKCTAEKPKQMLPGSWERRITRKCGYTEQQARVIYDMRKQGFSYNAISKEIGKSPNAIRKYAKSRWGKEVEVDRYQSGFIRGESARSKRKNTDADL